MRAFRAFWLCALETGKTSAEDVWKAALRWALEQKEEYCYECNDAPININLIERELNEVENL